MNRSVKINGVTRQSAARLVLAAVTAATVAFGGVILTPAAFSWAHVTRADVTPVAVPPPTIKGVPGQPGPTAPAATISSNIGLLHVTPQVGFAGTPVTVTGTGLASNASVILAWQTATETWTLDPEIGTVNYMGRQATKFNVVIAHATTDSNGKFSVTFKAPNDWGGVHEIYADIGGTDVAEGGFLISRRVTVTPKSGPIGTPITVTYTGFAADLYEGGAALLWDNHITGEMMANWTRGTAKFMIRAAGPVGYHTIEVGDAINFLYLNLPQASDSWAIGGTVKFHTTADKGRPKTQIDWPVNVQPTISTKTTMDPSAVASNSPVKMKLSTWSGQVGKRIKLTATGLTPNSPVDLEWLTVVGSRVNCTSVCWAESSIPLGKPTPSGTTLSTSFKVPDNLGGWHVVQVDQGGKTMAQKAFLMKESLVGKGVSSRVLNPGQAFTIHLKGVGWTQIDNTVGVDYDNSYVGYGCGFGSNGDVVLNLHATGGRGTHIIDIYPQLYTLTPSFANTPWGLIPILTYARDDPGLALGYKIPAIRLAITVR
jgi:hypothetical protein